MKKKKKKKKSNDDYKDVLYNLLVTPQNNYLLWVGKAYKEKLLGPFAFPWTEYVPSASEESFYGFPKENACIHKHSYDVNFLSTIITYTCFNM